MLRRGIAVTLIVGLGSFGVWYVMFGNWGLHQVVHFSTMRELRERRGMTSWMPKHVPEDARDIHLDYDMDTNIESGSVRVLPESMMKWQASIRRIPCPPPFQGECYIDEDIIRPTLLVVFDPAKDVVHFESLR